jgi:hypothetical protein
VGLIDGLTLATRLLKAWDSFKAWLRQASGSAKLEAAADKADQTGDTSDLEGAFSRKPADPK